METREDVSQAPHGGPRLVGLSVGSRRCWVCGAARGLLGLRPHSCGERLHSRDDHQACVTVRGGKISVPQDSAVAVCCHPRESPRLERCSVAGDGAQPLDETGCRVDSSRVGGSPDLKQAHLGRVPRAREAVVCVNGCQHGTWIGPLPLTSGIQIKNTGKQSCPGRSWGPRGRGSALRGRLGSVSPADCGLAPVPQPQ